MGGINYHTSGHPRCSRFPDTTSKLSQIAPKFLQKLNSLQPGCGLSGVLLVQYPDPHPFSRLFAGLLSAPQKNGTLNYRRFAGCSGLPLPDTPHTHTLYSTDAPAPHARLRLFCVPSSS
uniref:(northern house mosquito) hypothetical protein n=1 Tax=Culex pipiens TaxID=7175 RepID=A0A8D8MSB6_CULPI